MENNYKNYGVDVDKIIILEEEYIVGGEMVPEIIRQPDRNWIPFLPLGEPQVKAFDTFNCTGFGSGELVEIMMKRDFGEDFNGSDRHLGIEAGTRPPGNNPHLVLEAYRKKGVCREETLPFDGVEDTDQYYSYKDGNEAVCATEARSLIERMKLQHEWIVTPDASSEERIANIWRFLQSSPIGMTCTAWIKQDGLYIDNGLPNSHWCVIVGAVYGKYWIVRDSYPDGTEFIKDLAWNHKFMYAKRIHVEKLLPPPPALPVPTVVPPRLFSLLTLIETLLKKLVGTPTKENSPVVIESKPEPSPVEPEKPKSDFPTKNAEILYGVAKGYIGLDLANHAVAPASLSCALQVNAVFRKAFKKEIGGGASTARMFEVLLKDPRFEKVPIYEPAAIIISPSREWHGEIVQHGHVGICGKRQIISNNSLSGRLDTHYTKETWEAYYKSKLGLPVYYFRVL